MNSNARLLAFSCSGVLLITIGAFVVNAGPLDPPAGPVTPSYKTLTDVEPRIEVGASTTPGDGANVFIINKSGSYYLGGNISVPSGKNGITITASDVALDLNGFTITGAAGSLRGVTISGQRAHVHHGSIVSMGLDGLSNSAGSAVIEHVSAAGCGDDGISVGSASQVRNCSSTSSGGRGIAVGISSMVENCTVTAATGDGFEGSQTIFRHCTVNNSGVGISAGSACAVIDCNPQANKGDGIRVTGGCLVRGNNCVSNGTADPAAAGIRATGGDSRIEQNNCSFNDVGIAVSGSGNIILQNTCSGSSVNNYDIAASNRYGAIVNITGAGAAAALGNSAASTLTSTDPWANFAY